MVLELKDTVALMNSDDYKKRFKAEYLQLKIRRDKLKDMLTKWDRNELSFTPTCPKGLLMQQLNYMSAYLHLLKQRAAIEGIEL